MENWLTSNPIPGIVLWAILYISDYYLTLSAAKGFEKIGHFHYEGSYELTPQYQQDIDSRTPISKKHLTSLVFYTVLISLLWWIFAKLLNLQLVYSFYLGMLLLLETSVHMRHFRNLYLIRVVQKDGGVEGEIKYLKRFSYKISAFDLYLFSALYLITAVITFSPFFLGGAVMCAGMGFRHSRYAKAAIKKQLDMPTMDKNADPS